MALKYITTVAGLATVAAAASAGDAITAVSWGAQRIDVFGADSADNVFHKYYTAFGWGPDDDAHGSLEHFGSSNASAPVSSASWESNRLDIVFVDKDGIAQHKYWDGSSWQPNGMDGYEGLGNGVVGKLALNSWGPDRFDVVGLSKDNTYWHKAWVGDGYFPPKDLWEDFGGYFISEPATVSWGPERLDVFGITGDGNMAHKWWDGRQWNPPRQEWENLGGTHLAGTPTASSMAKNRFDIFAVNNKTGELLHQFWDGWTYSGWGNLGGNFTNAPSVIHWGPNRIDVLGKSANDSSYIYKFWDGHRWSGWFNKGGPFHTEPVLVSVGENNLNMLGVDDAGDLKLQVWDGAQWLPGEDGWFVLGNTQKGNDQAAAVAAGSDLPVVRGHDAAGAGEKETFTTKDKHLKIELRFTA